VPVEMSPLAYTWRCDCGHRVNRYDSPEDQATRQLWCLVCRRTQSFTRLAFPPARADTSLPPEAKGKGATGKKRGIVEGWSKRSRKTNWEILEALGRAMVITGASTVGPLPETDRLREYQDSIQRWLERMDIAHYGNWEGPRPHTHWLFCSRLFAGFAGEFTRFCEKQYRRYFPGHDLPDKLVDIDMELKRGQQAIARYYAKVDKFDYETKSPEACPWLMWTPCWHFHLPWWLLTPIIEQLPKTRPEVIARAIRRRRK